MARAVYKYALHSSPGVTLVSLPVGATPLHVGLQDDVPYLWALVDPDMRVTMVMPIVCAWTGHDIPMEAGAHLGTVQMEMSGLVCHYFYGVG